MEGLAAFWAESDAIGRTVVALLLAMSVSAWVLIAWKGWVLLRTRRDIARAVPAFWAADTLSAGSARLLALDREQVLLPLLLASTTTDAAGTLASRASGASQLTRRLRDALHQSLAHLQFGQVLLASIGSTSPFIGLFGTVWGIMRSFAAIAAEQNSSLAVVAPGIAEALFATAIGLFAAIPAVIAYNRFSPRLNQYEARMGRFADGFHGTLSRELEHEV